MFSAWHSSLCVMLATLVLACGNVVRGQSTFGISSVPLLGLWVGLIVNSFFVDTLHWRHLWLVAGLIWAGATMRESLRGPGGVAKSNQGRGTSEEPLDRPARRGRSRPHDFPGSVASECIDDYRLLDALEPDLAPIIIDPSRTELHVVPSANDSFEDDAFVRQVDHRSSAFVDDLAHPRANSNRLTAVLTHHAVEKKTTVLVVPVKRLLDLVFRLDSDEFSRLKIQYLPRRLRRPVSRQRRDTFWPPFINVSRGR